jgi:high-affinity iron transporter
MKNVFSVPIFFIVSDRPSACHLAYVSRFGAGTLQVFRETLEASIIVSVLLALVEQIVHEPRSGATTAVTTAHDPDHKPEKSDEDVDSKHDSPTAVSEDRQETRLLIKKMRKMVFLGSAAGFFIALAM